MNTPNSIVFCSYFCEGGGSFLWQDFEFEFKQLISIFSCLHQLFWETVTVRVQVLTLANLHLQDLDQTLVIQTVIHF